ncbi:MAG TPA: lysophospholipid acyltransferase family protein [Gemmataceae bacterium]|nr:lysophospholipid acyltransferase family protein [Gemmataceae bacterium]
MDEWKLQPARDLGLTGLERSRSLLRESGLVASMVRWCVWGILGVGFRLLHKLKVEGCENLPASPSFVMVANHASHFDALVLGAALPLAWRDAIFPVAAGDVFFERRGMAAIVTTLINALPVWRRRPGAHEINTLRQRLAGGNCIFILFPEGTRSRDGCMTPFKPGIGMMVAGSPVPVVPCHLCGTHDVFPPNRVLPRLLPITLRIGAPLDFTAVANTSAGWRQIAADLESAVRELMQ